MSDNNTAPAVNDAARTTAQADDAEAAMLARFADDDGLVDETASPSSPEADEGEKRTDKAEPEQSEQSDEDDVLFADEGDAKPKADEDKGKTEPAVIELDGEKVPLAIVKEWRDAGLRQADYTRKTQAVAEERAAVESYRAQVKQHEQDVAQALEMAQAIIKAYVPPEPDLNLALTDTAEYMRQKAIYDRSKAHLDQIIAQNATLTDKARAQQEQETTAQRNQRLAAEREALFKHFPQLSDAKRAQPFARKMDETLKAYGFPEGTFATVDDHRMVLALADAARWREFQARKTSGQQPGAKTPAPVASAPLKQRGTTEVRPQFEDRMRRAQTQRERDEILADRFND